MNTNPAKYTCDRVWYSHVQIYLPSFFETNPFVEEKPHIETYTVGHETVSTISFTWEDMKISAQIEPWVFPQHIYGPRINEIIQSAKHQVITDLSRRTDRQRTPLPELAELDKLCRTGVLTPELNYDKLAPPELFWAVFRVYDQSLEGLFQKSVELNESSLKGVQIAKNSCGVYVSSIYLLKNALQQAKKIYQQQILESL